MAKKNEIPKRKTVLFIVEGPADKAALESIFKTLYRENKVINFEFTGGDISSDKATNKDNVCDKINEIVNAYLRDKKLVKTDIYQIVQLFDMDGAYIPDEAAIEGDTKEFLYSTTNISCKNCQKIKERNQHKREIMDYLLGVDKIKSIPYEMYFVSCNLDHALYDMQNLEAENKQLLADEFYEYFSGKEKTFISFLEDKVSNDTPINYKASWDYIRTGLHSLERHTNLHVYFREHPIL